VTGGGPGIFSPPGAIRIRKRGGGSVSVGRPAAKRSGVRSAAMVSYERIGAAAVVTIDRPERRNAIDGPTASELRKAFDRFCADDSARVLVLTGGGDDAFCAGADLKAIDSLAPRMGDPGGPLGFTHLTSPKPTIAAVSGWCVAGGLEVAIWCDLRVASETARFGCLERRWGVPLIDGGTQRLPRIVGLGRALDLVLTGRTVEASEALAIGLVTEVVAPGRHVERALELAERLAAFPQETMLSDRRALLAGLGRPLDEGLAIEAREGSAVLMVGTGGAARFAAGAGRGGADA
jgi:enoyl-CoA hydratase